LEKLTELATKQESFEKKFDKLEGLEEKLEKKFDKLESVVKAGDIETLLDKLLTSKFTDLARKIDELDKKIDANKVAMDTKMDANKEILDSGLKLQAERASPTVPAQTSPEPTLVYPSAVAETTPAAATSSVPQGSTTPRKSFFLNPRKILSPRKGKQM